jgi:hypothetical protein
MWIGYNRMDKNIEIISDGQYSITDLHAFQTPRFNDSFPKGFVEDENMSCTSYESEGVNKGRTSSDFSDHFKRYSPNLRPASIDAQTEERVETGTCKCSIF